MVERNVVSDVQLIFQKPPHLLINTIFLLLAHLLHFWKHVYNLTHRYRYDKLGLVRKRAEFLSHLLMNVLDVCFR